MYDNACVQDTPDDQISFFIQIGGGGRSSSIAGQDFTTLMFSNIVHALPPVLKHVPPVRVGRKSPRRGMKVNSRVNKHCEIPGCGNISVNRGLCRGHGGGRRCHFAGCAKSAQSHSVFCWAHGGGRCCEVKGCMRSRKSKHFCVDHVGLESDSPVISTTLPETQVTIAANAAVFHGSPRLPCLPEALRNAQRSVLML